MAWDLESCAEGGGHGQVVLSSLQRVFGRYAKVFSRGDVFFRSSFEDFRPMLTGDRCCCRCC